MDMVTYRMNSDMPDKLREALPDVEDLGNYCNPKWLIL